MSAILGIDYKTSTLNKYLFYMLNQPGLFKVADEPRNLLPLLPYINPKQWHADNLFSKRNWVAKPYSEDKSIENKIYARRNRNHGLDTKSLKCFEQPSAWRWLMKASPVIIRAWVEDNYCQTAIIANLAQANISCKAPVAAYVFLMRQAPTMDYLGINASVQTFLRLFLHECATIWQTDGFKVFRSKLNSELGIQFTDLFDYLRGQGFQKGYPDHNDTWQSLRRRSEYWHNNRVFEKFNADNFSWESNLTEIEIDGYQFTALTNSFELWQETVRMKHCIESYSDYCYRGICNAIVPEATSNAGVKLVALYREQKHRCCNDQTLLR